MPSFALLRAELSTNPRTLLFLTAVSALSTTLILAVVNIAAEKAEAGGAGLRLALIFVIGIALFAISQKVVTRLTATEVEGLVDRMRLKVVDGIRHSDMQRLDLIGRSTAFTALTLDCQTISRSVPLIVVGAGQAVMLVCVSFYLAWLSLPAFGAITLFLAVAVWIHWQRIGELRFAMDRTQTDEMALFQGLGGMLRGLKEIRLHDLRAAQVVEDLADVSRRTAAEKTRIKYRWAQEYAGIQLVFYAVVGMMVFVVPLLSTGFHAEAVKATTAALFMIGPIGAVVQAVPSIGDAERALSGLYALAQQLRQGTEELSESAEPLASPQEIDLSRMSYHYPEDKGASGFSVGPLDIRFRAGEITFITGGNGSGKSTLLRLLVGLVPASEGILSVNGEAVRHEQMQAYRDHISAILADYHLFRRLYGIPPEAWEKAGPLLIRMGLESKVTVQDGAFSTIALSAGQRKRLALVVAELEDKPVMIFDEWAADQDPHFRRLFYEEILPSYRARGKMVICVTHDDRWFGVADRVLAMREGHLSDESDLWGESLGQDTSHS